MDRSATKLMENEDIIEKFSEFLTEFYYNELTTAINEGKMSVLVDFSLFDKFDPDLADYTLENPNEVFPVLNQAVERIDIPGETKLIVRFFNLPEGKNIRIRNLRSEHIGKLLAVDGIVKRASDIRPEVSEAIFQCPGCGAQIAVIQEERKIRPPTECECGYRKKFKLVGHKLYDARWITIEEPFEITSGERPSDITIFLKEDLTSPRMQNKTEPGNRIKVVGSLKEMPRRVKGTASRQMDIYVDANSVESVEVEWEELEITEEDEQKIMDLAKDPLVYQKLVNSIAPTIYGLEEIKEAIILQMFGGVPKVLKDGTHIRGEIHILLVGDPSTAKSQMMKLVSTMVPRGKYVSGRGVTYAGLTATVVRDEEFLGGWVLEAGAIVLANRSMCCIDEFGKVSTEDQVALQEAMSLGTVSIAKASIVATLPAQTSILAGGNPKLGRFDPYMPIREQVNVDDVLLSRFDLRFALRDVPNVEHDIKMVDHILKMRHFEEESAKPLIERDFLRKYVAYVKKNCQPQLTEEAAEEIKKFYLEMREKSAEGPVSITFRQYDSLIRMAESSAKIQLREKITVDDALRAITLMKASLRQFGFEPETGKIDIDRAEGQVSAAQRSKIRVMSDVIESLSAEYGKDVPQEEVIKRATKQGVANAEEMLRKMLEEGILFSPRKGFVQKVLS
jgi:replicative DNA helicase Mcm